MRKSLIIAAGAAVALVTAAVAFAVVPSVVGVHEVTATTFSTTAMSDLKTRDCTADAQTWKFTSAHYTGAVLSADPVLAGTLTIHARTTYNTTSALGYVNGSFRIRDDDSRVSGKFTGTLKAGQLVGFLTGKSHGNHAKVLGSMSATFAGDSTNFTDGKIGAGSNPGFAIVAGPACKPAKEPKPPKPAKRVHAEGTATLAGGPPPTTITVTPKHGPVTPPCTIPVAFNLGGAVTGSKVEMECEWVTVAPAAPVLTLTKLKLHK